MTTITVGSRTGNTFTGFVDTALSEGAPTANRNSDLSIYIQSASGNRSHLVLRVPGIKANVSGTVTGNSGSITLRNADAGITFNVALYKLLVPYVDAEVTWNKRNTSTNWTTAGALGTSDVVSLTPIATGVCPATAGADFTISGAGLAADFAAIVNGTSDDYGYLLCVDPDNTGSSAARIRATENALTGERPYATFDYTAVSVSASIGDVNVDRTDGTATVPVTLSSPAPVGGVTVNYSTQDSTATAPAYYTGTSGTLTFAEGETTKNVTVSITA